MKSDVELLRQWRSGDEVAGNELVARHFRSVYRFFRRRIDGAAEDLTQQTFLGCVQRRDNLRDDASFKAYLFGIARKQLLLHLRQQERHDRAIERRKATPAHETIGTPSGVIAKHQEQRLLLRALKQLPLELQMTLELYYWEHLTSSEVGSVLEIPVSTVTTRLARARELLKQHIANMDVSPDLRKSTVQNLEHWAKSLRDLLE